MAIDGVIASLLRVPLFAGLTPLQITEIGRRAQRRVFGRGEVIIEAGTPGEAAFLILSGEAAAKGGPAERARLESIEPGSLLGELAMFVDHVYATTVVAHGWVDCLKFERSALHAQMCDDADLAARLAQVIRGRLTQVAVELQEIDVLLAGVVRRATTFPAALPSPGVAASSAVKPSKVGRTLVTTDLIG
jgi:CRP-like cAMP-binding protein